MCRSIYWIIQFPWFITKATVSFHSECWHRIQWFSLVFFIHKCLRIMLSYSFTTFTSIFSLLWCTADESINLKTDLRIFTHRVTGRGHKKDKWQITIWLPRIEIREEQRKSILFWRWFDALLLKPFTSSHGRRMYKNRKRTLSIEWMGLIRSVGSLIFTYMIKDFAIQPTHQLLFQMLFFSL